jgi:carboxymethylenebutenolidase
MIQTQWLSLPTAQGEMTVYQACPAEEYLPDVSPTLRPVVLLWMEIFGLNPHICHVAERLAHAGYRVVAPDFFYQTAQPCQTWPYDEQGTLEGRQHKALVTPDVMHTVANACYDYLQANAVTSPLPTIYSMGFCFGGTVAYTLATLPWISATVSFYGAGIGDAANPDAPVHLTSAIKGPVLCLLGEDDPLIPPTHQHAIEQALSDAAAATGLPHQVKRYAQCGHGFFCDARPDYRPLAAEDAWQQVLHWFKLV